MSKSLAELRASTSTALPERAYEMCLSQGLVAEAMSLEQEKSDLQIERAGLTDTDDDGEPQRPPRRAGEGPNPRIAEIDSRLAEIVDRLEALWDEMREHTGELRVRGISAGEWRRWVDQHPAREDNKIDAEVTYGFCDAGALLADLQRYAVSWNGDPLAEGDWEFIANRAAPGDLKEVCRIVVQMHEAGGARPPKSRRPSSGNPVNGTASTSPDPSASAPSDSSAGSPASSTTTPTTTPGE